MVRGNPSIGRVAGGSIVRHGTLQDLDALVRLEKLGFSSDLFNREQFRYLLCRANATTFVLEQGGRVLGAAIMGWRKNSSVGHLYSIVTDPAVRGRGWGTKLLLACEDAAAERGCHRVSLEVRADNKQAIALYERHGYRLIDSIPGYYSDRTDALRMAKTLEIKEH